MLQHQHAMMIKKAENSKGRALTSQEHREITRDHAIGVEADHLRKSENPEYGALRSDTISHHLTIWEGNRAEQRWHVMKSYKNIAWIKAHGFGDMERALNKLKFNKDLWRQANRHVHALKKRLPVFEMQIAAE